MNSILVTGATGLLGCALVPTLYNNKDLKITTHAYSQSADIVFDLSIWGETFDCLNRVMPSIIINLVGLTSVEECENYPNKAYLTNTRTVENIARWIKESGNQCHLVHISTDQVYDGAGPHAENAVTLTNTYALTKYAGELAASLVPSTILRTNFVGRSKSAKRESLSDWVYQAMSFGRDVQVLNDVYFSPLSMLTLSNLIVQVLQRKPTGIYNLSSHDGMSKADFDFLLAEQIGLPTSTMKRIDRSQCTFFKAYRPNDMRMNPTLFENTMGTKLPQLIDEIQLVANEYKS